MSGTPRTEFLRIWHALEGLMLSPSSTEAPVLWPPDSKSQLIGKALNAGQD